MLRLSDVRPEVKDWENKTEVNWLSICLWPCAYRCAPTLQERRENGATDIGTTSVQVRRGVVAGACMDACMDDASSQ